MSHSPRKGTKPSRVYQDLCGCATTLNHAMIRDASKTRVNVGCSRRNNKGQGLVDGGASATREGLVTVTSSRHG